MAKETAFSDPPRGHSAMLVYDAVNDQWIGQRATIWAYDDRWAEDLGGTKSGAGTYTEDSTTVPSGEVWILENAYLCNDTGARGVVEIRAMLSGVTHFLARGISPAQYVHSGWIGHLTLKEDDYIQVLQYLCLDADVIRAGVWGYKMVVPS